MRTQIYFSNTIYQIATFFKVHSWEHTCEILKNNNLRHESFENFDTTPVGSGCCAQVYYAKYQNQEVAVKVLHPDIKRRFLRDLTVLRSIVNSVSWIFPQLHWLSIRESLEEFATLMNIQVNLKNEAMNLLKFHNNFKVNQLWKLLRFQNQQLVCIRFPCSDHS